MSTDARVATSALFDLDPASVRCPYPIFAALREQEPVAWFDEIEAFVVTQYDLIVEVLRHPELFSSRNTTGPTTDRQLRDLMRHLVTDDAEVRAMVERRRAHGTSPVLVRADPPIHGRQRALVNRAFSPSVVRSLEPDIQALTDRLIDAFADDGRVELAGELAVPLPMTVIATALGVATERMDDFKRWSDGIVGGVGRNDMGTEELTLVVKSRSELEEYMLEVIEQRVVEPQEDLVSRIVHAEIDGERLTTHETLDMLAQFLIAGNETTAKLITATMLRLACDPVQADRLRADTSLVAPYIEEVLRLEPPSSGLYRIATADCEVGGVAIPAGSALWLAFAAGNRDDVQFEEADACIVGRGAKPPHLGFGLGAHFCVGAGLARAEARIAVQSLLERFSRVELDVDESSIQYEESFMVHGIKSLPLRLEGAR